MKGNFSAGFGYLLRGYRLMKEPSLRRYMIIPLFLNLSICGFLFGFGFEIAAGWIQQILALLPDWLYFLRWLMWPIATLLVLTIAVYLVSICANIVAAPFNTLLAEKAEQLLTGTITADSSLFATLEDAPRSIGKELGKILHYLSRALLVLVLTSLLAWVPPLYPLAPLLWFVLGAWMLALEYCDYPLDNHRYSLAQVRQAIGGERLTSYGFGTAVLLASMLPLLNLIIMPAAVCGATLYWVERLKPTAATDSRIQPLNKHLQPRRLNR
jgi:CysZ protein